MSAGWQQWSHNTAQQYTKIGFWKHFRHEIDNIQDCGSYLSSTFTVWVKVSLDPTSVLWVKAKWREVSHNLHILPTLKWYKAGWQRLPLKTWWGLRKGKGSLIMMWRKRSCVHSFTIMTNQIKQNHLNRFLESVGSHSLPTNTHSFCSSPTLYGQFYYVSFIIIYNCTGREDVSTAWNKANLHIMANKCVMNGSHGWN